MGAEVQLDMFSNLTPEDLMRAEIAVLKESQGAVRRKTFAMIGDLTKMVLEMQKQVDALNVKVGITDARNRNDGADRASRAIPINSG